ncbi:unnamed protein product [Rotaria sordida]|uniref:ADP-ribosylglycohydrolase n=1 Tax=Rotaria sordida TaxID=392033 RepID=A0A819TA93_9BILA|nr:unnamed protein product [Rotaria sordida]CAF4075646.1 unnamed protein product [Rotaria sordida]
MINTYTRCEGAFIGHAIASKYDPSILMALNISQSLVECQKFDGSDILSRYLYLYHTKKCEIGEITKYIYQETLKRNDTQSLISRENFRFDQSVIDEIVKLADKKFEGRTAGCGPAQRSYPLAFCQYIKDDDLFDCTLLEAKLTHNNPIAGQVAGIVNLICRSLINNNDWNDAVNSALATPRLHKDIMEMAFHRNRRFYHDLGTPAAYAPTALNSALYCVSVSDNAAQAIANACDKDKSYCAPIVGILAGARWGIPLETYKDNINDLQLAPLRDIASKLSTIWKSKNDGPHY